MAVFGFSLEGKPWYYGLIAGLVVAAIGGFLVNKQYFSKMREEIDAKERNLEQLEVKIQEGRAAQQKLPQFREEVRRLETELEKLLKILPARRNTPDLLRRIRALAEQGDFVLSTFRVQPEVDKEFYVEWPIYISLSGTYHNLALFFDRVSRFPRIVNVDNLEIRGADQQTDNSTIVANFTAKTFIYKEGTAEDEEADGEGVDP